MVKIDMNDQWYVYLVRCQNNALYCGITNNIEERIKKHNSGKGSKSCRAHGLPVKLAWNDEVPDKSSALKMEAKIKKLSKKQKEQLVNSQLNRGVAELVKALDC